MAVVPRKRKKKAAVTATANIKLLVGLGNPGAEYQNTRHNAGAWFIEALCHYHNVTLSPESKFFGRTARITTSEFDLRVLVPDTFMNLSGKSLIAMTQFFKLEPENVLVAHDELDLDPGVVKLKQNGGHGGHNGLRDIIQKFGGNKTFFRLRIGIGHPGNKNQVHGFVLGKASQPEQQKIDAAVEEAVRIIPTVSSGDIAGAMNRLHSFKG